MIRTQDKHQNNFITSRTFILYSALFMLISIAMFSLYFAQGGSFIWESDGFSQHFQLFDDYVKVLQGLFRGESFSHWNWSIGPGADTITAYGYYVLGDPFVYLGVLFPEPLRELSFHILILLRVWCVGMSYLFFVRKFKVSHHAGLIGAVMYTFSFYAILNINRHPFFILPMIWFPLFCLGIEKIIRKESGLLFTVITAIGAISNFYFFYKLTILTFIYAVVRYGLLYGFKDVKQLSKTVGRSLLHYVIGLMISAVVFLPMVFGFLSASRSSEGIAVNLLYYNLDYYGALIHNLFVPDSAFWSVGGFSIFTLFGMYYLWKTRREKNFIAYILIILTVFLLFPFFGSFMNGLSGPYNRFTFAVPFYLSLATGLFIDKREQFNRKDLKTVGAILSLFTILYLFRMVSTQNYIYYLTPVILGWGMWSVLWFEAHQYKKLSHKYTVTTVLLSLITLNMIMNGLNYYLPHGRNSIETTKEFNTSIEEYSHLFGGLESKLPDGEVYRVGNTSRDNHVRNQYIYHKAMGLSNYLSITNGYISEFSEELMLAPYQVIQPLRNGMDDRRFANYLMNVEYIISDQENEQYLPAGYEIIEQDESTGFIMAQTQNHFPLAYIQEEVLSYETFSQLNPIEKEEALLNAAVLDEATDSLQIDQALTSREVDYQIAFDKETLEATEPQSIEVTEADELITLTVEDINDLENHELFISLEGMDYTAGKRPFYMREKSGYDIVFRYNDRRKSFRQSDKYTFSTYFHRDQFFVNLGEINTDEDELTVTFADVGQYNIGDISLYALPIDSDKDEQTAKEKQQYALEITTFEDDNIEGTLQSEAEGVLVTSIPYEEGWRVEVDGSPVDTIRTNIGFVGIPVKPEDRTVQFSYTNPYIKAGFIITLIGLAELIFVEWVFRRID